MNPRILHRKVVMAPHTLIISESEVSIAVLCLPFAQHELLEKYICNQCSHYEKHNGAVCPSYCLKLKYPLPFSVSYGTDHAQRHIRSHLWVCSRLNNCRGRERGTCFAHECTSLSVLCDIRKWNRCYALFWVMIKSQANPWVRVSATLREICTVCSTHSLHSSTNQGLFEKNLCNQGSHYE